MLTLVDEKFPNLKYMKRKQADIIKDLIVKNNLSSLLELGTYQGKGTAYMATILEGRGGIGSVTTLDREDCLRMTPNVHQVISSLGLAHRVKVELHPRSFTITLMHMLEQNPRPQFDFCYFDGAHNWDGTGFSFLLVNKLLKPGAWVIFDDLDWTIYKSEKRRAKNIKMYKDYGEAEKKIKQVRKVWEILVPYEGYINRSENKYGWGIAQKP